MGYYLGDYYTGDSRRSRGATTRRGRKRAARGKGGGKLGRALELAESLGGALKGRGRGLGVRRRRINVGNVRALRRSMRRVQGFAKLARRTIGFTHRVKLKKHKRRV